MGLFPGFGSWINQNLQQRRKDESNRSRNANSKSESEKNTQEERDEMKEQLTLWRDAEKKKQWHDDPPKVKTKLAEEGIYEMDIKFTIGLPPRAAYDVLTNTENQSFSRFIKGRELLENVSRKVEMENIGDQENIVAVDKRLSWNFLCFHGTIPIPLIVMENPRDLSVKIGRDAKKMKYIKFFLGKYKVEPIYVDSERLCKHVKPKSREEYDTCSGRKGRIASKVTLRMGLKPSFPLNLPPFVWYFRRFTDKTTKILIEDLQNRGIIIRGS